MKQGIKIGEFQSTRWSLVAKVRGGVAGSAQADVALRELCALYYAPILGFLQRSGYSAETTEDLAHGFIAWLLERGNVGTPKASRGKFRSYLLGMLKHYVSTEARRERALKRGGGQVVSWDELRETATEPLPDAAAAAGGGYADASELDYERQWAATLLHNTLAALEQRYATDGKQELFDTLRPAVAGGSLPAYQDLAQTLGSTEVAVRMAVSRLRQRFRQELRAQVAETVATPSAVDEELFHLITTLRGGGVTMETEKPKDE